MKRFVISGAAFYAFRSELIEGLPLIIEQVTAHTTVLDYKTVCSILSGPAQCAPPQSELLLIGLTGVLQDDMQAVMEQIAPGREKAAVHLVLNCALASPQQAASLARSIQYSMPMLKEHVASFSLVCNDAEIPEYAGMLSQFFRAARLGWDRKQLKRAYRHILFHAWYIRYLSWSPVMRFAASMYQKIRGFLKNGATA